MRPLHKILTLAATVLLLATTACSVDSGPITSITTADIPYPIAVTPQLKSLPVNTTQIFTATTNAPSSEVIWTVQQVASAGGAGSPTSQNGGLTFTYTAPAYPPLYQPTAGPIQGTVTLSATTGSTYTDTQTFFITAPTITLGFIDPPTKLALGASVTIYAYAVGSIMNGFTIQVNGITGGNSTVGLIVPYTGPGATYGEYIYTAPTSIPFTSNPITLTAVSSAPVTGTAMAPSASIVFPLY